jgi:hypothetical protein
LGIKHHEYWPWWLLVACPYGPCGLGYMLRTRNLTWFTAVNPGMEDSGFLGESKIKILEFHTRTVQTQNYFYFLSSTH